MTGYQFCFGHADGCGRKNGSGYGDQFDYAQEHGRGYGGGCGDGDGDGEGCGYEYGDGFYFE